MSREPSLKNHNDNEDHKKTDRCLMAYERIRDNEIIEFCIECLYNIRDEIDPRRKN